MVTLEENLTNKKPPCVTIGLDDARRLRAKLQGMKRAALNIQMNAKTFAEDADGVIKILDLIIEPERP